MPSLHAIILFTTAAIAITLCPGPSMVYVMSRSVAQGRTAGCFSALGLSTGLLLHTLAACMGLSVIFIYSPLIYTIVKVLGALYLLFLGLQMLLSRNHALDPENGAAKTARYRIYGQGIVTEILNPKTALFYLSFLPQFVDPSQGHPGFQMFVFGCILLLTALSMDLFIAMTGGAMSGWFRRNPIVNKGQQWLAGTVLIGLGIRLAISQRR